MALEMKSDCERCGAAFICSFECTFCADCAHSLDQACPNCRGELVRRPRRAKM